MVSHHWRWSLLLWFLAGCSQQQAPLGPTEISGLRERALECLKLGISYEYLPTVRAYVVEALQETTGDEALPWMRHALLDEHPAVRFAAGVALGTRRDELAAPMIRKMLHSDQSSDRIAACFALYRLGEAERAADLATYLLDDVDPAVRANAALVLGRMEEPGVKVP